MIGVKITQVIMFPVVAKATTENIIAHYWKLFSCKLRYIFGSNISVSLSVRFRHLKSFLFGDSFVRKGSDWHVGILERLVISMQLAEEEGIQWTGCRATRILSISLNWRKICLGNSRRHRNKPVRISLDYCINKKMVWHHRWNPRKRWEEDPNLGISCPCLDPLI